MDGNMDSVIATMQVSTAMLLGLFSSGNAALSTFPNVEHFIYLLCIICIIIYHLFIFYCGLGTIPAF